MNFEYETDRLLLKILQADSARQILDFYYRNKTIFEPFEPTKPYNYYTVEYQKKLTGYEYNLALHLKYVRFFVMEKNAPDYIIGTISFSNIQLYPYLSCITGYKFDSVHQGQGFSSEAMHKCISIIFKELKLHRIEAYIMPKNTSSIRFIERQGFQYEGINYKQIEIDGKWQDHLRYSLINH